MSTPHQLSPVQLQLILNEDPACLLVQVADNPSFVMRVDDLKAFLVEAKESDEHIDLTAIPVLRRKVTSIPLQATLSEALMKLNQERADALYVQRGIEDTDSRLGILTRQDIESEYQL
jgi:CBS-domain-containing membrane protein